MRFSRAFKISRGPREDWFDPDLSVDTRLFLDPFLLLKAGRTWVRAHEDLVSHFAHCYALVAKAQGPKSLSAKAAHRLLTFPEPYEFGLGYTAASTRGSGGGLMQAHSIADGIAVAVVAGLIEPEHIEEIGILNEGFGADRISDATLNVLKARFITYTQTIAARHDVALQKHQVRNAGVDLAAARWCDDVVELPTNPVTGDPILLVPKKLLRDLPTLNAEDWFQSDVNDEVRTYLNLKVGQSIPKREIVKLARRNPEQVREWARRQTTRTDLTGYNFGEDPRGVVNYDTATVEFAHTHPLPETAPPRNQAELSTLVGRVLGNFKTFVEQGGGWRLLWNSDGSEKNEDAAQLLFMGMAREYLRLYGVEVDREVELGRGPVDFKVSAGYNIRLLIEVKKAHTGTFWNGLNDQLPSYLTSDDTGEGWLVAIRYRDAKSTTDRLTQLPTAVTQAADRTGMSLHYIAIDGRRPLSASKIR
ncbi:MAG: hypothetical protein ACTHK1_05230 [Actinomycetales bacterium]